MKIDEITSVVMNEKELILTTLNKIVSIEYKKIKRIEQEQNNVIVNNIKIEFNDFNSATLFFYSLINIKKLQ